MKKENLIVGKLYFITGEGDNFNKLLEIREHSAYFDSGQESFTKIISEVPQYLINKKIKQLELQLKILKEHGSTNDYFIINKDNPSTNVSKDKLKTLLNMEVLIFLEEDTLEGVIIDIDKEITKVNIKSKIFNLPTNLIYVADGVCFDLDKSFDLYDELNILI